MTERTPATARRWGGATTPARAAMKIIVSAGLLLYLFTWVSPRAVFAAAAAAGLGTYVGVTVGLFVFLLLGAVRVYQVVRVFAPIPFASVAIMYCRAVAFGAFTPGQLGELSLAYFLHRHGVDPAASLAVSAVDRFTTLVTLLLMAAAGLGLYFPDLAGQWLWFPLAPLALGTFAVATASGRHLLRSIVTRTVPAAVPFCDAFGRFFVAHPGRAALNVGLGFGRWFCAAFMLLVVIVPLENEPVSWLFVLVANAAARLITYVPVSINGLGVLELGAVELFRRGGIPADVTLAAFVVNRLIYYLFATTCVLLWLWRDAHMRSAYREKPATLNL